MTHRRLSGQLLAMATWLTLSLGLAGCGKRLSGTYVADLPLVGSMSVEFKSGDKAMVTLLGQTSEVNYTVEDDKLILHNAQGNQVYTIQSDGSLTSGEGLLSMTLKKK